LISENTIIKHTYIAYKSRIKHVAKFINVVLISINVGTMIYK